MAKNDQQELGPRRSLRTTFNLYVAGLVTTVCILIAGANLFSDHRRNSELVRSEATEVATLMAAMATTDLKYREVRRLEELAKGLSAQPSVNAISIYDRDTNRVISQGRGALDYGALEVTAVRALTADQTELLSGRHVVTAAHPILDDGQVLGAVVVEVDRFALANAFWEAVVWNLGLSAAMIGLAYPVTTRLVRHVTEPLQRLTDFARAMSAKRLSARIDIKTGNEFETLGWAFNRMVQRLDSSMSRIQRLAFMDPITELPNRERFNRELNEAVAQNAPGQRIAVILMDIERFRWVNETLGPQKGDEALAIVGRRVAKALHTADRMVRLEKADTKPSIVARLGADEFGIVVPEITNKDQVGRILQTIVASMRQPLELGSHQVTLGLTSGIAIGPNDTEAAEDLIKNADLALKEAKRAGPGQAKFFTQRLNQAALDRLLLENEIRRGIDENEFIAFYQPKIDFETGEIRGAEALARWRKPSGEMVSPGTFIPLAEELGIIGGIGRSIMRSACREATEWMKQGFDCRVAVNVSPIQFEDSGFADFVLESLREAGLPPGRLELEVTESMAVNEPDRVSEIMRPLRAMGVRLAIDDFGAGHSNLITLTQLPFDVFKIDQQFVRALHSDRQAPAIIEMILAMAEAMGLETVAEGVETVSQSDFLRRRGCTVAQGFLYSPPLPAPEFAEFLSEWKPFGDSSTLAAQLAS